MKERMKDMGKKRYTPEQIIRLLREVEVLVSQGLTTPEAITLNPMLNNQIEKLRINS